MAIFAVDPGPTHSSFVIWNGDKIIDHDTVGNDELLNYIRLDDLGCRPQGFAVEMIASYGMPVGKEIFETCVLIGRLLEAWDFGGARQGDPIYRIEVKKHICHDSRAKDANIRQALIDRLGPPGTKKQPGVTYGLKGGEWQALALAVTWWDKHQYDWKPA